MSAATLVVAACAFSGSLVAFGFQSSPLSPPTVFFRPDSCLPSSSAIQPNNYRSRQGCLLRVATAAGGDNSSAKEAMIRQIDLKIQKYEREQQKYSAKVESAKAELQKFIATKQRYLDGAKLADDAAANFSETNARSLVKAMMWRFIAACITFLTSLRFSGSISTALSIVGSDFFSKAATMYIGERLMNQSQAGRKSGADNVQRSLAKALLWRLFAVTTTLTMSFMIAKNLSMASKIAGSDAIFKTGLMFLFERVWAKIEWGKEYLIEFSI